MYVCVYTYISLYLSIYIYIYTYVYVYIYTYVYIHIHVYIYVYIYTYLGVRGIHMCRGVLTCKTRKERHARVGISSHAMSFYIRQHDALSRDVTYHLPGTDDRTRFTCLHAFAMRHVICNVSCTTCRVLHITYHRP